jgi:predicted nucleic acid-binding protein
MAVVVIDSSIALAWFLQDERRIETDRLYERSLSVRVLVPVHWRLEIGNALTIALRRRRISHAIRSAILNELAQAPIETDLEGVEASWHRTLALADQHQLELYDAAYVELAERAGAALWTLDGDLRKAAAAQSLTLEPA